MMMIKKANQITFLKTIKESIILIIKKKLTKNNSKKILIFKKELKIFIKFKIIELEILKINLMLYHKV